jgi:hypothetical protein
MAKDWEPRQGRKKLMAEIEQLDAAYAAIDVERAANAPGDEAEAEEAEAAEEQSLDYFNRYIAGDR